jgi:lipopolysaccharide export system protein LptA
MRTSVINKALSLRLFALAVPLSIMLSGIAGAQEMPSGQMSGPIDIQANEQEFSGDQVIARGNVRVTFKDSVILAPLATLTRDPAGKPQRAVFTGHPKLLQGENTIDAEVLTFDMVGSRIIAEGRAHSEVVSESDDKSSTTAKPEKANTKKEKIVTDSDRQEYDRIGDKFEALGHVRVLHGDILVNSDKLALVYGANKKPETAIFTGNVTATQNQNSTSADTIAYSLATKRLQATGHVRSKVIQQKAEIQKNVGQPTAAIDAPPAMASSKTAKSGETETIIITSDSQDYSKETNRLSANGNVKVYYQDTVGAGPQAVLIRNEQGKAERMYFIGRSQITQPGRRWIADRISFTVADKKVLAEGNTKAIILQKPGQSNNMGPDIQFGGRPATGSLSSRKVNNLQ